MIRSTSPQRPGDVVVSFTATSADGVTAAVERARAAQRDWAADAPARAQALTAAADAVAGAAGELADLVVREVGKPLTEARGEVARSVSILRYYAQQVFDPLGATHAASAGGLLFTTRRPRGVAGLITPWNFPLAIPLWKAAPALAFGNAVLLKPAQDSTACGLRLAEVLGLPAGLVTVLPGDAATGRAVAGAADVVSFTGSTGVGRAVVEAAALRGVPVQAEMGGQNPAVVLPDADLGAAASMIAGAVAGYAGQKCTATKRVIVVGEAAGFVEALVAAVEALPVGDPADAATVVGPVISAAARDRVVAAVDAPVLTGGTAPDRDGWFVAPTLLAGLPADHPLERTEVFGPICSVSSARSVDEALARADGVRHGLVGGLYSRDLNAALAAADRLATGLVKINAPTTGVDFFVPFGGVKDSGFGGKEQGKAALETFTSSHTVTVAPG